jgi:hypothetical protein
MKSSWYDATWERRQVSVFKKDEIPSKELINKILEEATRNVPVFAGHWHHEVEIYGPEYEEDKHKLCLQGVEEISIRKKYDIRSPCYVGYGAPLSNIQHHLDFFLEEIENGNVKRKGLRDEQGNPIVSFNTELLAPYLLKFKYSPNKFIPSSSSVGIKGENKESQWEKYVQTSISHAIIISIVAKHYGVDSGFCGCFILSDNNPNRIYYNQYDVILFLGLGYADPERCYKSNYGDIESMIGKDKEKVRANYEDICTWR